MTKKLLYSALVVALAAVAVVSFALPAGAEQRTFRVKLVDNSVITVTVQATCAPMDQVPGLPGTPIEDLTPPDVCGDIGSDPTAPTTPQQTPPPPDDGNGGNNGGSNGSNDGTNGNAGGPPTAGRPSTGRGHRQDHSGS